ncbi:hypothetical protein AGIG_G17403 [Arapaima gigas]
MTTRSFDSRRGGDTPPSCSRLHKYFIADGGKSRATEESKGEGRRRSFSSQRGTADPKDPSDNPLRPESPAGFAPATDHYYERPWCPLD